MGTVVARELDAGGHGRSPEAVQLFAAEHRAQAAAVGSGFRAAGDGKAQHKQRKENGPRNDAASLPAW